jgi:hypothetical protein
MSDSDNDYYDNLAEEWESYGGGGGGGGGGGTKKKKPKVATTVGKKRIGGTQAWGSSDKVCAKGCAKKCCSGAAKNTPAL